MIKINEFVSEYSHTRVRLNEIYNPIFVYDVTNKTTTLNVTPKLHEKTVLTTSTCGNIFR